MAEIDSALLPFIDSESRQLLRTGVLSVEDHQALLDEAKKYREAWLATLNPTREQILGVAHQEDRDHVASGNSNEQRWKALEADWYRKQKPTAEDVLKARNPAPEQPKPESATPDKSDVADEWYSHDPNDVSLLTGRRRKFSAIRIPKKARDPQLEAHEAALRRQQEAEQQRFEASQREAKNDETRKARDLENAFDNALKRAEDRARRNQGMDEFSKRMGFTPIGEEPPSSPETESVKPRQPIRRFLEHFAGLGFFAGSLAMIGIDEYGLAGALLVLAGIAFFVQISEWNLFPGRKGAGRTVKLILYLSVVAAFVFFGAVFWNRKGDKPWTNLFVTNKNTFCVFVANPTGDHAAYPLNVFVYGKEPMLNVTVTIQPVRPDSRPDDIRQLPLGDGTLLAGVHPVAFAVPPGKYILTVWSRTGLITEELELRMVNGTIIQTANVWGEGKRLYDLDATGAVTIH